MPKEIPEISMPPAPDGSDAAEIKKEQIRRAGEITNEIKAIQGERALADLKVSELRKVLELYENIKKIAQGEIDPSTPEFAEAKTELQKSEQEAIKKYFGKAAMGIEVPPVPAEITREQFEFWKENKFRLHYSPGLEIKKDNEFPGQEKKLDNDIYMWMAEGQIAADSATLPKGWILIDERPKPEYDDGKQMYEDDLLAPVLLDLREKGLIEDYTEPGSRFNISADELNMPEVKDAIAKALKVRPEQLEAMKAVLFNYIGNKSHPEWGRTDTWEWFQDKYGSSRRLNGGFSGRGGLSGAYCDSSGRRRARLGFRLSVRFSV